MVSLNKQECRWHSFDTTADLEHAATVAILHSAQKAIAERGAFYMVLAGGTTPRRVYERLSRSVAEWTRWHIYFGDERCLPPEDFERNSRMAQDAWLAHVAIPAAQVRPIPTEQGAQLAADSYSALLAEIERFDLVLLGLGEDGHTASLFPGHTLGTEPGAAAALAVHGAPKPPPERVSLSAHRLSRARQVMFLVTGEGKREIVSDWKSGADIVAARITPDNGVDVYLEAALLSHSEANDQHSK
jgi:6-phosphogluconolactonase